MNLDQSIPPFVVPSESSTSAFLLIVFTLIVALVVAVRRAPEGEAPSVTRRWAVGAAVGVSAWAAFTGLLSGSGVLEIEAPAPPALGFFLVCNLAAVALALSPVGRRLVVTTPIAFLVGYQAFRLPLELVLHSWMEQGTMPVQMTWEGQNFDILTGIVSVGFGLYAYRREVPGALVWAVNLLGLGLLLNVMRIAMLSTPMPLRTFVNDPPVLLAYHFPYGWIVPFCVSGALFGHLVVVRWSLANRAAG